MHKYLTETEFSKIKKYFVVKTGRPRTYDIFSILNAVFHILVTGSQWRNLPGDYPPYRTVFYHFNRWKKNKTIHTVLSELLKQKPRDLLVIDNQSISDSDLPSNTHKGYDGHKKRKGRKRCILTDRHGFIHCAKYYPANMHDTDCARNILEYYKLTPFGREKKNRNRNKKLVRQVLVYGDKGFWSPRIRTWAKKHNIDYQAIPKLKKPDTNTKIGWELWKEQYGYIVDAIKGVRWVVERTFAWLQKYRRLNMNYERTISSLEVMTILAAIRMILRRKMV